MSTKKKKEKGESVIQQEEKIKALILADSFSNEYKPVTLDKPRVLLPLVNVPILDYILEMLAASKIQEIYVFCCYGAKLINDYISKSKWANPQKVGGVKVSTISSKRVQNTGDALRQIHEMDIFRSDFVLVSGDVISNLDLRPIIQKHKLEKKNSTASQLVMTSVFREEKSSKANARHGKDAITAIIAPKTNELLYYETELEHFDLPLQKLTDHKTIEVRSDLVDCHIDICTPEVLGLFADNFDFTDFREHFLKTYVLHEELVNYKVYPYIISQEYAARVSSLRTYELVSRDVVRRWMFPICPDSNFTNLTSYQFIRPNNYYENGINLANTCKIGTDSVIGSGTIIGDNSHIRSSVIGRNVKIGKDVKIVDSFIWDDAVIEDGCSIEKSLVASRTKICKQAVLQRGSVISCGVIVGPNFVVKEHTRLTIYDEKPAEEETNSNATSTADSSRKIVTKEEHVGVGGMGHEYSFDKSNKFNLLGVTEQDFSGVEYHKGDELVVQPPVEYNEELTQFGEHNLEKFYEEAQKGIIRAVRENHSLDNAKLEMGALKLAHDSEFIDCGNAALIGIILSTDDGQKSSTELLKSFKAALHPSAKGKTVWKNLLETYVKSHHDQLELLDYLLDFCKGVGFKFGPLMQFLIRILYDEDVITEDAVLEWYDSIKEANVEAEVKLVKQLDDFVEWLKNASEEEEEDDD